MSGNAGGLLPRRPASAEGLRHPSQSGHYRQSLIAALQVLGGERRSRIRAADSTYMNVTKQPETLCRRLCSHVAVPPTRRQSPATIVASAIAVLMLGLALALVIAAVQGRVNVDGQFGISVNWGTVLGTWEVPESHNSPRASLSRRL